MRILPVLLLSTCAVGILAAGPAPQTSPAPARSAAPLSKFQRERLEKFKNSAPADEYFGRMKMSYLGINNTFRDAAIASGEHTLEPAIVNKVALANDALEDWARRFPRDPQLPRSYFLAIQSEKRIWLRPNQDRAWVYMNRIVQIFPTTFFGKTVKKDLDIGFTEHYYAEAVPCSTPTPMATPTVQPAVTPSEEPRRGARATPTPTPTSTPQPSATPTPTATPTASPRVLARNLKAQILTPDCVPPSTPTPTPTATPTPAPAATPSPAFAPQPTTIPQPQPMIGPVPTSTPAAAGTPPAVPTPQTTASPKSRTEAKAGTA